MEFLVNAVELVAIVPGRIREIDLCRTVTVDTPAHAEWRKLFYFIHFLDGAVAGLALYFTRLGMLCMAEEYMVGKAVDLDPLHRFSSSCIVAARLGIIAGIAV